MAAGLGLPIVARYDPSLPTAYQRCKAAVVGLLPEWIRSVLPARKQYFTRALAESVRAELDVSVAAAAGLLDTDALATTDTATRMTAAAVESWLVGALAAGYRIPGIGQAYVAGQGIQRSS
ncbi:MAG: hypothetical protein ACRDQ5_10630 [Sciscionella sp.]